MRILLGIFWALPALAQTPDTTRLADVVTTASRLPAVRAAATGSRTVITAQEMQERGNLLLIDLLRDVPGLVPVQSGSYGAVTSVFLRGGESDYVKVMIDGVPMNTAGGAFNFANLTTDNLDRVEIIRGPAGVLYGSDAMAGVIQIFTKSGQEGGKPSVTAQFGGLGNRSLQAGLDNSGKIGSFNIAGNSQRSDGFLPFNSEYRNSGISARLASSPGIAPVEAAWTIRYTDSKAHFPTDGIGVPVDSNQFTEERQLATGLELSRSFGAHWALTGSGRWSRTDAEFQDRRDFPGDTTDFGFEAFRVGRQDRSGITLRATYLASSKWQTVLGAEYEDERERQNGSTSSNFGFGQFTELDSFRAERSTRAVYSETAFTPTSTVLFTAGARLDDNSAFGEFFTWRLGGSIGLAPSLRVRAQVGRAFKAPTFAELFAFSPFEVGNPDLDPERSTSWEIGVESNFLDNRLTMNLAWFDQQFSDLIQFVFSEPGSPTYFNLTDASSRGAEATASFQLLPGLAVNGQLTVQRTRVDENREFDSPAFEAGRRLLRRPAFHAAWGLQYHSGTNTVFRIDFNRLGARDDLDFSSFPSQRLTLPGRTLVDLSARLGIGWLAPGLAVLGRVENLLDNDWQQVAGFQARGRVAFLGVTAGR